MESSQVACPGPSTPARNNNHLFTANVWGDTDTGEAVPELCLFRGHFIAGAKHWVRVWWENINLHNNHTLIHIQ
jgi:hypothetical protein